MELPKLGLPLTSEQLQLLRAFSRSCRRSALQMVTNAKSGHPGGSLSALDYLSLLYLFLVSQTNEPVVISNGHISPAVYAVLGELGVFEKERAIKNFRKPNDIFEGHVNRRVPGIYYSTGPLGVGASVASGFAWGDKYRGSHEFTYLVMGDGENQEGMVYEMMNFAAKYHLNNLIGFIDYNQIQLTASLDEIMPLNIKGYYEAAGWEVFEVNGHDFSAMWDVLGRAHESRTKPVLILGHTVMGKGVSFMEQVAHEGKADWHGVAPSAEQNAAASLELASSDEDEALIRAFVQQFPHKIKTPDMPNLWTKIEGIDVGEPVTYPADKLTDCRGAYGSALADLAKRNKNILAMTADLAGSVKTDGVKKNSPAQHIECGIAEQHMVSAAGGLSLRGFVPFCSTFGAFMSSRAKDQARVNDINEANVKMVATHCGLSVGEDGPTHQAIDDMSSFLGFMHTNVLEPVDPNQCDRMIRYVASVSGNFYVRMGRAKLPVITREDGTPFFAGSYVFEPGRADIVREGTDVTIVASGPMVERAMKVANTLSAVNANPASASKSVEVIAVSSLRPFDEETILKSARKTGRVVTVEDHHSATGLGSLVLQTLARARCVDQTGMPVLVKTLGVHEYQLSGTCDELYEKAGLGLQHIEETVKGMMA